jgi:hypothetical protein
MKFSYKILIGLTTLVVLIAGIIALFPQSCTSIGQINFAPTQCSCLGIETNIACSLDGSGCQSLCYGIILDKDPTI